MEAPAEIKVKTRKFSLTKGTIKISFELEGSRGRIRSLKLKQRNAVLDTSFPFEITSRKTSIPRQVQRVSNTSVTQACVFEQALQTWGAFVNKVL